MDLVRVNTRSLSPSTSTTTYADEVFHVMFSNNRLPRSSHPFVGLSYDVKHLAGRLGSEIALIGKKALDERYVVK